MTRFFCLLTNTNSAALAYCLCLLLVGCQQEEQAMNFQDHPRHVITEESEFEVYVDSIQKTLPVNTYLSSGTNKGAISHQILTYTGMLLDSNGLTSSEWDISENARLQLIRMAKRLVDNKHQSESTEIKFYKNWGLNKRKFLVTHTLTTYSDLEYNLSMNVLQDDSAARGGFFAKQAYDENSTTSEVEAKRHSIVVHKYFADVAYHFLVEFEGKNGRTEIRQLVFYVPSRNALYSPEKLK